MTTPNTPSKEITQQDRELIKTIEGYLTQEGYRFHFIAEDCIEMYLQGKNLTMRMLIYAHNRHLVVRVPAFIRNVEMRRTEFLVELMDLMNEYFDIRFEMSDDGKNLSGASNHIVEDGQMSKGQFNQALMVVAYMVDEQYPRLLKILYGQGSVPVEEPQPKNFNDEVGSEGSSDAGETQEKTHEDEPLKKPKLN